MAVALVLVLARLWLGADGKDLSIKLDLSAYKNKYFSIPSYNAGIIVDGTPVTTLIDTGSTGLVIARHNALRKDASCKTNENRCAWAHDIKPFLFISCYSDGSGYAVWPQTERTLTFGPLPPTAVTIGDAIGVFDPDKTMTNDNRGYANIWGLGTHGGKDCSFSATDALSDLFRQHSLPHIWSLRSVSSTGEARMYLGARLGASHTHTTMLERDGRYIVSVSGLAVTDSGKSGAEKSFLAAKFVLDTGHLTLTLALP